MSNDSNQPGMNPPHQQGAQPSTSGDTLVADVLIARSIDGEASDQQWAMLEEAADEKALKGDAMLWRRVAMSYRDAQLVRQGVERGVGAIAEGVDLPSVREAMEHPVIARIDANTENSLRGGGWSRWGGWGVAAAALLTLAVTMQAPRSSTPGSSTRGSSQVASGPIAPMQGAGLGSGLADVGAATFTTAADALDAYLARGRAEGSVVGQGANRQVLQYAALPEGGYEVFYVRPIIERATVQDLYQLGINEAGNFRPVPVRRETVPVAERPRPTRVGL